MRSPKGGACYAKETYIMTATAVMTTLRMSISLKSSPPVAVCRDIDPLQNELSAVSPRKDKKLIAEG
jgi:hypothetical protein